MNNQNLQNGNFAIQEINKVLPAHQQLKVVKETTSGKDVLVLAESGTREILNNFTNLQTLYYPALQVRVVSQSVEKIYSGKNPAGKAFKKESWVNGVKDIFMNSLLTPTTLTNLGKVIVIGDFNPVDPINYQITCYIDKTYKVAIKFTQNELVQAFTSPEALGKFLNDLLVKLKDSMEWTYYQAEAAILLDDPTAVISIGANEIVDVTSLIVSGDEQKTDLNILQAVDAKLMSLQLPSNTTLNINPSDPNMVYDLPAEETILIWNSEFKASVNANINSKLFNPKYINAEGIENIILDPSQIPNVTVDSKWKLTILDKRKLRKGYMGENISNSIIVPNAQTLNELINAYGYAAVPWYVAVIFAEVPVTPIFKSLKGTNISLSQSIDINGNTVHKPGATIKFEPKMTKLSLKKSTTPTQEESTTPTQEESTTPTQEESKTIFKIISSGEPHTVKGDPSYETYEGAEKDCKILNDKYPKAKFIVVEQKG